MNICLNIGALQFIKAVNHLPIWATNVKGRKHVIGRNTGQNARYRLFWKGESARQSSEVL
jgi:hypothetical protein